MKKYFHSLFILLFVAACLIPAAGLAVNGPSPAAGNETPVRAPSLTQPDGSFNVEFLSDAADWFSRSFGFRREMITLDSGLKAGLFRTSPQSLVALGKGDWLYYAETLDDYTGADSLTPRQAWCIARSLRLAQDYVQSQGAAFAFTIAPNKASIYPEYLPDGLRPAGTEYSAPVVEALEEQGVHYADLFAPLRAQKADLEAERGPYYDPLYFTTDSHWTSFGAALGHDVLLDSLGLPDHSLFDPDGGFPGESWSGDLYEMLYPAAPPAEREFCLTEGFSFQYTRPIRDVDDLRIETASASENGPLLMFRDSFGNALHRLMAGSFSSARFSRAVPYDLGQMEELGAEYVAVEIVERNLPLLAEGAFLMPAPEVAELPWGEEYLFDQEHFYVGEGSPQVEPSGPYTKVTAAVSAACDVDSPIYLVHMAPDGIRQVWEAFPETFPGLEDQMIHCTAYVQGDVAAEDLHVVFRQNGQWRAALNDQRYRDEISGLWLGEGAFPIPAQELEKSPWEGESIPIEDLKLEEVGSVKIEPGGQYSKVTATIGIACDTDSPVYLVTFSGTASTTLPLTFWEAQPTCLSEETTSCTAYFPAETQLERGFYMAFRKDGRWQMARTENADVLSGEEG